MTEEIYAESLSKILKNKSKLEKEFDIEITNRGKLIFINSSEPLNEYTAIKAVEALNMGFSIDTAVLLKDEDFSFEKINIKDISHRKNLQEVRARIIGTHRNCLDLIENLSSCSIKLHDNAVGIIGKIEDIEKARHALTSLIRGSKHSNVFGYLKREKEKS